MCYYNLYTVKLRGKLKNYLISVYPNGVSRGGLEAFTDTFKDFDARERQVYNKLGLGEKIRSK